MDVKKNILDLLEEDYGFRSEIKRLLDIDDLEREVDEKLFSRR